MPMLGALFANLFGGLIGWLGGYFTKRTANYVALIALTATAAAAMWVAVTALVSGLSVALPSFMTIPLTWLIPSNFDDCLSAYLAAEVACAGYRWHRDTVRAAAGA